MAAALLAVVEAMVGDGDMNIPNRPCVACGGTDRFYLITHPNNGGAPYWRCRACDYTEPHDEDEVFEGATPDHILRQRQRTPEEIAESHYAYGVVAERCAAALWSKAGAEALAYLQKRGLSTPMIKGAKLGYCADGLAFFTDLFYQDKRAYEGAMIGGLRKGQGIPRPVCRTTITIPYFQGDTCVLLRGRKLHPKRDEPKYLSPQGPLYAGAAPAFYLHHVLEGASAVILTEGELKALVAHQEWRAGRSPYPCVATSGVMYLPTALIEALQGKIVYLAYDNEKPKRGERESPGERAISRNGSKLRQAGIAVKVIELPRAADQSKVDLDSYIVATRPATRTA